GTPTTVTATNILNKYVKITITTGSGNTVVSSLTHYLIVTNGLNTIFMATYATAEPSVGELRWITRLQASKLTYGPIPSDTRGNTGAIESTDVFGMADGTTRSKYYGDTASHGKDRAMDLTYCGATGTSVGVWMVFDNPRESSAGGPFFRDIENQDGGDQEIYNYMNSGHNQTETYRTNVLYGPYALVFNGSSPPAAPMDYSWMDTAGLNLTGYVPRASRGAVQGSVSGIPTGFQGVIAFTNTTAQYWAVVASNGTYMTPLMKTGTYGALLYKGELVVTSATATVSAGVTNTLNLTSGESNPSHIFRIGEWDGTPNGFLNATNIVAMAEPNFITMHPSDVRMTPWVGPPTYIVESNSPSSFPSIEMRLTNSPITIKFNLAPNQITNLTLRIGITCAYHNGRPQVVIGNYTNGPSASTQPDSRSFTIGTYRGNNAMFTYNISSNNFVVGQNALTIAPISGTGDLGPWLSAGYVFDCIELDGPASISPPSAPTGLVAILTNAQVNLTWNFSAGATGYNAKRSSVSGGPYSVIASNIPTTSVNDTNVVAGTFYYYVVSALNAGGESADSTETNVYVPSLFEQWQMSYFGCSNCPEASASADPDGDGMSNTNEFLAGTNPTNSGSVFRILSITSQDGDLVTTWQAAGGHTNAVQAASGDYSSNFVDISSPIILGGSGDTITNYIDLGSATNTSPTYYRIRLVP
ncbi:MAG TPA: rhamnogalacturonan lyase B N-terminal domain-containing protein, partial [Verrucomicrobiae bacterium]|nr:rhamnogalacturonan lyase B N-terminal domain-containing protein [Verrucomicrobiae bacterium]